MLCDVLHSDERDPSIPEASDIYAWLLGEWDVTVTDISDAGERETPGEWHFGRTLEGRAIQDVFIVPSRSARGGEGAPGNRYGNSIRVYDRAADSWRITWINPVSLTEVRLVGRREEDDIVQTGVDTDGSLMRWTFCEIAPDSFKWIGEVSSDEGESWFTHSVFVGTRKKQD
jgi:hypothetical protein